jgi:glycine/D-amino acid oxidase-like deaminating enzyme
VLVLDKGRVGGGASGIAGGIVRNYYRSEPIAELVMGADACLERGALHTASSGPYPWT